MVTIICSNYLSVSAEAKIAFFALIVSAIGVFISIWTIVSTRKHNKLSVKPIAYILPQNYEDKVCVNIQNKGTGPLIVKEISFTDIIDKRTTNSLIELMPELKNGYHWSNFSSADKFVLSPNETKELLKLTGDIDDDIYIDNREIIREKLSKVQIKIKYTGIYEGKSIILIHDLKWFERI
ncbi:hypothetical protein BEI02_11165 [Elizabethkingia sp. HvH-WGS333]|uniref:hypothetical protein n=1 Tax=Elizabethkingia TaxID=308865 RepID=UPI0007417BC5|nr:MULTISPECIES: hypothetical protein [Elizabethkingia]KUG11035.1 hypothetical protein AMC91_15270 [Elizabethkingia miricola]MCL1656475.1 hypothetical protein [Elizabethkingia miricola]OIK47640.1 hypothetical protein BEI02_11165 [Elizabethkingia sp. HvH-WGS333]